MLQHPEEGPIGIPSFSSAAEKMFASSGVLNFRNKVIPQFPSSTGRKEKLFVDTKWFLTV